MISINFFSEPEDKKPNRKKKGREPLLPSQNRNRIKENDDISSSGSIPDPESLDFEEYEDEDPGSDNLNGEDNEDPEEGNESAKKDSSKGRSATTDPENLDQEDQHNY